MGDSRREAQQVPYHGLAMALGRPTPSSVQPATEEKQTTDDENRVASAGERSRVRRAIREIWVWGSWRSKK
jgi:hypothetical protein